MDVTMVLNNDTVSVITVKSFTAPLQIYTLNGFKWPHNMCWTAITQQKAYILKALRVLHEVFVSWLWQEHWPGPVPNRKRGRLQKEVVKDTSMGNGENLGMTESVSPEMPEKLVRKASSQSPLRYTLSHISHSSSRFLFRSLSRSWQEPRAEVWLMPVCSSSERTKEPAHSRERSHLAKTESFDSEERVNFSLAELKVFL